MSAKTTHATDRAWERYGATDPYYGVIANDELRFYYGKQNRGVRLSGG